jgi:hypothetical protein
LDAFYTAHGDDESLPSRTVAANLTDRQVRYLTFIPLPFVLAFIDGLLPRVAWNRAAEIIQFLPVADRAQFTYLFNFLRAACHKNTGANAESKMLVGMHSSSNGAYCKL